jgi:hypothetical protein
MRARYLGVRRTDQLDGALRERVARCLPHPERVRDVQIDVGYWRRHQGQGAFYRVRLQLCLSSAQSLTIDSFEQADLESAMGAAFAAAEQRVGSAASLAAHRLHSHSDAELRLLPLHGVSTEPRTPAG